VTTILWVRPLTVTARTFTRAGANQRALVPAAAFAAAAAGDAAPRPHAESGRHWLRRPPRPRVDREELT